MNRSFRTVWNESTQSWTAVQECAKGRGKSHSSRRTSLRGLILGSLLAPAAGFAQTVPPNAPAPTQLPTGGEVSAGQASIAQQGAAMTIGQASQRAVIDWKGFDVGRDATVTFQQPGASAVTLNRVQGVDASQIHGQIKANGQVFISNLAGVYFAPTSSVNVGGLTATTRTADSDAFMAGKDPFTGRADGGAVVNEGQIAAPAGSITLQGDSVVNVGTLDASSLVNKGGKIVLEAQAIDLKAGSQIKADGATGGGTVHVGDGWQGAGDMRQASSVHMDKGVSISANATQSGDGGEVVLWSDVHQAGGKTTAQGHVEAKAAGSGQGGRVETSGHAVDFDGIKVDTRAADDSAGTWLIDPYNYTINGTAAGNIASALDTSNVNVTTASSNTAQGGSSNAADAGDITVTSEGAINYTGSSARTLSLTADRDIAFNANITSTGGALGLNAIAKGKINQAAGVQVATRGGEVLYSSNSAGGNAGGIRMNAGSKIDTTIGGTGGANVTLGGGNAAGSGNVSATFAVRGSDSNAAGTIAGIAILNADIVAGSGNVVLRSEARQSFTSGDEDYVRIHGLAMISDDKASHRITGRDLTISGWSLAGAGVHGVRFVREPLINSTW